MIVVCSPLVTVDVLTACQLPVRLGGDNGGLNFEVLPPPHATSKTAIPLTKTPKSPLRQSPYSSLPQIGRELEVDAIVEGAVQLSGNRVRITAQLVDARTDKHLWAEDYDRDLSNVLLLQSEVARDIAGKIDVQLTPQQQRQLENQLHPVVPEAYEAYLLGRYYWNKRTADGLSRAGNYFQTAIDKDPSFALAYTGLADYYAFLTLLGGLRSCRPARPWQRPSQPL